MLNLLSRNDPDIAGLEDIGRHDADLAFARGHHARAVRADQPRFRSGERTFHPHHIKHRNAFGDADDQRDFGIDGFADRVRRTGRRHIDHRCISAGLLARFGHGIEHRQAKMCGAAFAGRGATDHLGAIGDRRFGMKGAVLARKALANDFGILVDQDGHGWDYFRADAVRVQLIRL